MTYSKQIYRSPIGLLSLVADQEKLRGIWFLEQKYLECGLEGVPLDQTKPVLEDTKEWLAAYFAGESLDMRDFKLAHSGSEFQERVWACLREIPYGETATYGEIAKGLKIASAQAVGGAVGRNPFSILVPCHRVLGSKGQLTGYAGGIEKKIWLLNHEGIAFRE